MKQVIRHNKKVIGTYDPETNTFTKMVNSTKHKVRVFDAYGITEKVFDDFLFNRNATIRIVEDNQREYVTTASEMNRVGVRRKLGSFEPQIFLPLNSFVRTESQQKLWT